MKTRHSSALGYCPEHDKLLYASKKDAKSIAKQHNTHMNVYRCDILDHLWHVGNLAGPVVRGEVDRASMYNTRRTA